MSVAIVGNGFSLKNNKYGYEITKVDTIIRVNMFEDLLDRQKTGLRTDIYACQEHSINRCKTNSAIWLFKNEDYPLELQKKLERKYNFKVSVKQCSGLERKIREFNNLRPNADASPSLGAQVIDYCLSYFTNEFIKVYGIDFFQNHPIDYYWLKVNNAIDKTLDVEKYKAEMNYFMNLSDESNGRLIIKGI